MFDSTSERLARFESAHLSSAARFTWLARFSAAASESDARNLEFFFPLWSTSAVKLPALFFSSSAG